MAIPNRKIAVYPLRGVLSAIGWSDAQASLFVSDYLSQSAISWGDEAQRTCATWRYLCSVIERSLDVMGGSLHREWKKVLRPSALVAIDF